MSRYLPFGREIIPTQRQVQFQQYKFQQYDYYGIPYGMFDASNEGEGHQTTQRDKDIEEARLFINSQQPLPSDLKERLLKHKKQNQTL